LGQKLRPPPPRLPCRLEFRPRCTGSHHILSRCHRCLHQRGHREARVTRLTPRVSSLLPSPLTKETCLCDKEQPTKAPQVPPSSRPYEYGHSGMTNWMSTDASPSSSKPSDLNATWRSYPAESPITPAFSPYTPHAPPPSAAWSASVGSESSSRDDIGWSNYPAPPPRSLSFGGESVPSHQQYPSISQLSNSSRPYDRKSTSISSEMYPQPIATTIPGIETVPGTTMEHGVSLSAGAVPPSSYGSWQQPYPYPKQSEGYGGWYGEAGAQQHLGSGEQHPSEHSHSGPNMYYER
jgi:hypothetical protein